MPSLIGVSEFVEETTADYKSPITSTFVSRMQNMKQTISTLEDVSTSSLYFIRTNEKKINLSFDSTKFRLSIIECY
jgi:hypothetical protein